MTNITVYQWEGKIVGLRAQGHAGAGIHGEDIVCSAISVLTQTAVNALEAIAGVRTSPKVKDGLLEMHLPRELTEDQAQTSQVILGTVVQGLTDVQNSYPKFVRILWEEWRNSHASNESATVRP